MTETELIDYNETITDFSVLIQNYGPLAVIKDFSEFHPNTYKQFINTANTINRGHQIAALFKPKAT